MTCAVLVPVSAGAQSAQIMSPTPSSTEFNYGSHSLSPEPQENGYSSFTDLRFVYL